VGSSFNKSDARERRIPDGVVDTNFQDVGVLHAREEKKQQWWWVRVGVGVVSAVEA